MEEFVDCKFGSRRVVSGSDQGANSSGQYKRSIWYLPVKRRFWGGRIGEMEGARKRTSEKVQKYQ